MQVRDLREKSEKELSDLLKQQRELGRGLRFKASQTQLKNIWELRAAKKLVAKILTIIKEKNNN